MKVFENEQATVCPPKDAEDPQDSLGEEHDRLVRPLTRISPPLRHEAGQDGPKRLEFWIVRWSRVPEL
jgi:hypothetical protein